MSKQQKTGCILALIRILIIQPLWYYLLYKILQAVGASVLMWAAFWLYLPLGILLLVVESAALSAFEGRGIISPSKENKNDRATNRSRGTR